MEPLKQILFTPGHVAGRRHCTDRLEPLRKLDLNPVFQAEKPWEEDGIHWGSVIRSREDGKFRFFYSTAHGATGKTGTARIDAAQVGTRRQVGCYAESEDGIHWRRPALNRMDQDRFPDNNIIWSWPGVYNDSLSVIEDPRDPDPQRRYKMLIYHHDAERPDLRGGFCFVSPDGFHWRRTGPMLPTQDAECLWRDPLTGQYLAFLKDRKGDNRCRMLSVSQDFEHWSEPQWIILPERGDDPGIQFYSQSAFVMAEQRLGFLNVYDVVTQTSWMELVESPDGHSWRRMPSASPILQPSGPGTPDGGGAYVGLSEPILVGEEYWYYYYASPGRHSLADPEPTGKPSLCVAAFTRDRLVGQQTEGEGLFTTLPFRCPGGELRLDFRATGAVRVALLRPGYGEALPGFGREECVPVTGDQRAAEIVWRSGRRLDELGDRFIRLEISGQDAVVYRASFVDPGHGA